MNLICLGRTYTKYKNLAPDDRSSPKRQMEILAYWARTGNKEREGVGCVQNTSGKQGLEISDRPENAGNRTLYAVVVEDFTYAYRTN